MASKYINHGIFHVDADSFNAHEKKIHREMERALFSCDILMQTNDIYPNMHLF